MTTWFGSFPALVGATTLIAMSGCGDSANSSATQTAGASEATASSTSTSDGPTTSGSDSDSNSNTATEGTGSASMTSLPTTGDPTSSTTQTSMTSSTTGPDTTSTTMPVSTSDTTSTTSTTSTTDPDTTTGTTDPDTTTGTTSDSDGTTTGPGCIPTEEVCNDIDDDCNGIVDDLDIAGDGICDCLNIALFGNKGSNPSAQFEAWLEAQGTQVDRLQTDNTPLTEELLAQYDVVILDWLVRTYAPGEAALMESWVAEGGGLMSMTGHTNNNTVVERPNSLIAPMGLSYNASQGFFNGPVTQWLKPHPLTQDISSVSFYGGLFIDIVEDGVGDNEVIGTLPPGPVAVAQVRKNGKLYIFGDEWIEFDSEWQNIPEIKQLWVNILAWLSPQNFCTVPQ